jgi:hypothetical protein
MARTAYRRRKGSMKRSVVKPYKKHRKMAKNKKIQGSKFQIPSSKSQSPNLSEANDSYLVELWNLLFLVFDLGSWNLDLGI